MRHIAIIGCAALAACGGAPQAGNDSMASQAPSAPTTAPVATPSPESTEAAMSDAAIDAQDSGEPSGKMPALGQCFSTTIKEVTSRLEGEPDSGTALLLADGHSQVSYEIEPAAERARAGDAVKMCAASLPHDCPAGDFRGVLYRTLDLRTGEAWELPNAAHTCGGA